VPEALWTRLTVSKRGFHSLDKRAAATVQMAADRMSNVSVKLIPLGAVEGRVLNEDGEPLPGVSVALVQISIQDGRRITREATSKNTDDRGEYRLWDL